MKSRHDPTSVHRNLSALTEGIPDRAHPRLHQLSQLQPGSEHLGEHRRAGRSRLTGKERGEPWETSQILWDGWGEPLGGHLGGGVIPPQHPQHPHSGKESEAQRLNIPPAGTQQMGRVRI